jgi:hypothetical protein
MEQILIGIISGYLLALTVVCAKNRNSCTRLDKKHRNLQREVTNFYQLFTGRRKDSNIPSIKPLRKPIVNSDEKIYQREQQQESRHGLA